jgi:hypothetical protein
MTSKKSIGMLFLWAIIMSCFLLAALTCWWFGRKIEDIDEKIETIEKK